MSMNTIFQVPFFSSEAVSEQKFFQPLHWSISDVTTKERLSYDHLGDTRLEKQTDAQPPDAEHIRIMEGLFHIRQIYIDDYINGYIYIFRDD